MPQNLHWYDANEARSYPVDDAATALTDDDRRLPSNIVVDLSLRWPQAYGDTAFLAALTVTDKVVALAIEAESDAGFVPLAVLTMTKASAVPGRAYALQAQLPGVAGWVVFGSGLADAPFRGRFEGAAAAKLTARAAHPYQEPGVVSARASGHRTPLSGLIRIRAQAPLEVTAEDVEIDGVVRRAGVFRLVEEAQSVTDVGGAGSVFHRFAGPCGGRPESRTCNDPQPIEFINAVGADCTGLITLDFRGCAFVAQNLDTCGAILSCDVGLSVACPPPFIPDSDGRLPSEYEPDPSPTTTTTTPEPEPEESQSVSSRDDLPYCESFDSGVATDWLVDAGAFAFVVDDMPGEDDIPGVVDTGVLSYASTNTASYNISHWNSFELQNLGRRVYAGLKIPSGGPAGSRRNAGILLNYKPHPTMTGRFVWFAAVLDYDRKEVRLLRFNGTAIFEIVAVSAPGLQMDEWYAVDVRAAVGFPDPPPDTAITIYVAGITTPTFSAALGPVSVTSYAPSTGDHGVFSDRSLARFSYWCYDNIPTV